MTWIIQQRRNVFGVHLYEHRRRKSDLSAVIRWTATVGPSDVIDSEMYPECFNWTDYQDAEDGGDILVLSFGSLNLPKGVQPLRLVYYEGIDDGVGIEAENYLNIPIRENPDVITEGPSSYLTLPDQFGTLHAVTMEMQPNTTSYRIGIDEIPPGEQTADHLVFTDPLGDDHSFSVELDEVENPYIGMDVRTPTETPMLTLTLIPRWQGTRILTLHRVRLSVDLDEAGNPYPKVT